jgi:hypothetical protein
MVHDPEISTLIQRAQRACEDLTIVREKLAITRGETQRLLAQAHMKPTDSVEPPRDDPHVLAMDALHVMRDILTDFPLEWQVTIVKALTARTLLVVAEQTRAPHITAAA